MRQFEMRAEMMVQSKWDPGIAGYITLSRTIHLKISLAHCDAPCACLINAFTEEVKQLKNHRVPTREFSFRRSELKRVEQDTRRIYYGWLRLSRELACHGAEKREPTLHLSMSSANRFFSVRFAAKKIARP